MLSKFKALLNFSKPRLQEQELKLVALTAVFAVILNVLAVIFPILQKNLIDSISTKELNSNIIFIFLMVGITVSITSVLESLILNNLFMKFKNNIEIELLESVTRHDNKMLKARGPGAFMVSIFGDSEQIASLLNTNYFSVLAVCIATLITLIVSTSWTMIFSYIVIISYILIFIIIKISNKIYVTNFDEARNFVYELNPKVLEFIENRKSIMSYVNIRMYEASLKLLFNKRDAKFKTAFAANAMGSTGLNSVKNLAITVFFVLSMPQIINNQLEVSSFIALLAYFNVVFIPVNALHELSSGLDRFEVLYNRIKENIDITPKSSLPKGPSIYLKNCSFSYEQGKTDITNLDLRLDQKIGLVGLTGEGKTTTLKMLMGELIPHDGAVLYGGTNVTTLPKSMIYSSIRLYAQDTEIFDESLQFNIALGKLSLPQAEYEVRLQKLTKDIRNSLLWIMTDKAQLSNDKESKYINILMNLYDLNEKQISNVEIRNQLWQNLKGENIENIADTIAPNYLARMCYIQEKYAQILIDLKIEYLNNRRFGQRGKDISGGEKNKVALARFLLPEGNAPFIIDEPFSNLDLLSEQENLGILRKYSAKHNGIIISHKMNVIKSLSDTIYVLEDGEISERGTHDELIANKGLYNRLYNKFLENAATI